MWIGFSIYNLFCSRVSRKESVRERESCLTMKKRFDTKKKLSSFEKKKTANLYSSRTKETWARRTLRAPRPSRGGLRGEWSRGRCARIAIGKAERESRKKKAPICFFFFFLNFCDGSLSLPQPRPLPSTQLNSAKKTKRENSSTPPPAFAPVPPPPHPTYDLLASIRAALEEDAGGVGDLTTQAT